MERSWFGQMLAGLAMVIMVCSVSAVAADFSTWNHGMKVTFTGYNRPETLTNFPVLVVFTNGLGGGFNYGDFLSLTNQDLRFSASNGTDEQSYEIENWNTNGSSYVWVKMPGLATTNNSIYAYWGKAAQTTPAYTTNGAVWDSSFRGVWHLAEASGSDYDST